MKRRIIWSDQCIHKFWPQRDQKRLGHLKKSLGMMDMCIYIINMHVCNTTNSLKYKKRRIRRRRIAPTKEKPKKIGRMVAPAQNFDLKILPEASAKLRWAGLGQKTSYLIASAVCMWSSGKKNAFDVGGPSSIDFIYFWEAAKLRCAGLAAPCLGRKWAEKDGCAQRTGAHARPKPTSL